MTAIQKTPASEYLVADSDGLLRGRAGPSRPRRGAARRRRALDTSA